MQAPKAKVGHLADRFELKSQAGTGGMGTVYQALDLATGDRVALKILNVKGANDAARFVQEAAVLAELHHPAIVRYVDSGVTSQGDQYIAMEWLEGETLDDRLARGPMPPGRVARLASRILSGLAVAHAKGIVHRDIKPSNVFLVGWRLSQAKLLDFGIARRVADPKRLTRQGATVGTPMYASPEQARGERTLDGRADIFSLGCVLFECLAGEPPFTGDTPATVMARICMGRAPLIAERVPGIDQRLANLVQRMLTSDRNERPGDASQLAREFESIAARLDVADSASGGTFFGPAPEEGAGRDMLSESEQRVMALLMMSLAPPPKPSVRNPVAATCVMPVAAANGPIPVEMSREALTSLQTIVEPFGARLDRLIDRSLVVTVPQSSGLTEQVEQAARLALRLKVALPDARFALCAGRGVLLARLPMGEVVESAAALVDATEPGAIALDDTCGRLLQAQFDVAEPEAALRREGRRLLGERVGDERVRSVLGGGPTPFFGRDRELSTLRGLYDECLAESVPRVGVISGASGVGKTRVVHELLARLAAEGATPALLRARAVLVRQATPFLALRGLLEQAGVATRGDVQPAAARDALVRLFEERSRERPLVVVIDDLQHADLASVQLLDAVMGSLRDAPVLLLVTARPEADERFPGLFQERAPLRLRLAPLSRKGAELLLRRILPGVAPETSSWVLARADGSPFLIEELARYCLLPGRDPLPDTAVGLAQARFDAAGAEAKRVLRAGSLLGDTFTVDGVVALLGERARRDLPAHLNALIERGVLERCPESTEEVRFRVPLYREAAYQTIAAADRALGRRLVRTYLEESGRTIPEYLLSGNSANAFPLPTPPGG